MSVPAPVKPTFGLARLTVVPAFRAMTKVDWHDTEKLPDTGFILAANHISHIDPIGLGYMVYSNGFIPHFMAKRELFEAPVLGPLLKYVRQIPVDRGSRFDHSLEVAGNVLADGGVIIIYPEGTITKDPDYWPMQAKSGAARLALKTGAPLVPVGQWGINELLPRYEKKLHLRPRPTNAIAVADPMDLSAYRDKPINGTMLKSINGELMEIITERVAYLRQETPPEGIFNLATKTREKRP